MSTKIALAGIGKIARDQHVPTIAATDQFELIAAVTSHQQPDGVPGFRSIGEMMQAMPEVEALSICTPPRGRTALIAEALGHGLDVMIEKPLAATISEAEGFAPLAQEAGGCSTPPGIRERRQAWSRLANGLPSARSVLGRRRGVAPFEE